MVARRAAVDEDGLARGYERGAGPADRVLLGDLPGVAGVEDEIVRPWLQRPRPAVDSLEHLLLLQVEKVAADRGHGGGCELDKLLHRNEFGGAQVGQNLRFAFLGVHGANCERN